MGINTGFTNVILSGSDNFQTLLGSNSSTNFSNKRILLITSFMNQTDFDTKGVYSIRMLMDFFGL